MQNYNQQQQAVILKGIANQILSMNMPSFEEANKLFIIFDVNNLKKEDALKCSGYFIGQDNSMGFRSKTYYNLDICLYNNSIFISHGDFGEYCKYESLKSFLNNWEQIKKIKS